MSDQKATTGQVVTPEFRVVFPNLFEPRAIKRNGKETGEPKYSLVALFDPQEIEPLKQAALAVAREKWPGRDLKELKFPFKAGADAKKAAEAKGKDGSFYEGKVVVKAASKYKPQLVDMKGNDILDKNAVYSGCYARAEFNFVAYDKVNEETRDGVTAYVNFVLKTRDGQRVAGKDARTVFAGIIGNVVDEDPTGGDDEIPF